MTPPTSVQARGQSFRDRIFRRWIHCLMFSRDTLNLYIWYNDNMRIIKLNINVDINIFFLLAGHKVDFIAPCGAKKSIFWPHRRKKIVCSTGKTFILQVWLLPSLCSGIKLHTCKINFFSVVAQYTNVPPARKLVFPLQLRVTECCVFCYRGI